MRYSPYMLVQAALLRMKSCATYLHMRSSKLIPLPSLSTIRKLVSSSDCRFGSNELALQHIEKALKDLPEHERYGTLMWDEMAIQRDLTWDSKNCKWDGPVSYGGDVTERETENELADHALMFVFRPFMGAWVQPFAIYATKSAASGDVLAELIVKAILEALPISSHRNFRKDLLLSRCSTPSKMYEKQFFETSRSLGILFFWRIIS